MDLIKQIENQIDVIENVKKAREAFEAGTLKINWETDIDKMEFSKLHTAPNVNKKIARIEYEPISEDIKSNLNHESSFFDLIDVGGKDRMPNLLRVVMSNVKVIPPYEQRIFSIINGIKSPDYHTSADGWHRRLLSHFLGLVKIPTVVEDIIRDYCFDPNKWIFYAEDNTLKVNAIDGDQVYEFDLSDWYIDICDLEYVRLFPR